MRQFNTLTGFLLSTSSSPTTSDTVEFQGFTSIGDGYTAKFQHNGIIGQTASQSPIDLGLATPTLNDADGNQWVLINGAIQEFNDVLFYPAPFGDSGKGLYSYLDYIWVKLSDTTFISPITTTDLINSSASFSSEVNITTTGFTTSGDSGAGSWIQNGVTAQTASQSPAQLGDALLNDASGNQWAFIGNALFTEQIGGVLDGVTDNVLIQRAFIEFGDRTKKNIYLGIGTLLTSDSIRLIDKEGVNIIGLNRYSSILKLGDSVGDSFFTTLRDNNCSIKNLTIDGNGSNQVAGHCIRLEDSTNFSADSVELLNGNSYGVGAQGGTIDGFKLTNFNINNCGLDGIDIKNYNNNNANIIIDNGFIGNFGNTLTQQAGLDHRGKIKCSNVTIYLDVDTCRGFRTRNDGAAGFGGEGEYTNIRVENRLGASAPVAVAFSHTSPRGNLTVNGLVSVDCSNGIRIEADGDDSNFSNVTMSNTLALSGADQILILGSRNIISGFKITGASRYIDIAAGAEENVLSNFRCSGTTTASGIRINAAAELTQLAIGLTSSQGIADSSATSTITAITVAAI